ncbi:MAG: PadR family transcriptional regulator [Actinomycetota bacterium]|nr:PadR family transcriptional regulator [Actinomycetota bacterium]
MSSTRLSETSYIVLGLLEQAEPATPYDLKRLAQLSTVNFWTVPHTQLYTECARLAREGLLSERREETGRRRRIYCVTERGREVLDDWRSQPTEALEEVRDAGLLKLFFGADPARLAARQLEAHRRQLVAYEQLFESSGQDMPRGMRLALEAGIGHEREFVRFWSGLAQTSATETDG